MPLSAAGLVIVAFLLGRRLGGPDTALIAAAAVGASPILIFQSVQPMSDVPAAFWWSLAVLLLSRWRVFVQSALIAVSIAAPFVIRRRWVDPEIDAGAAARVAWSGLVLYAALQTTYLLYLVFEDWVVRPQIDAITDTTTGAAGGRVSSPPLLAIRIPRTPGAPDPAWRSARWSRR